MVTLNHRLEGRAQAPCVVLSSSLGATLEMWDPQVEALSERFRVLRYDHRGHGGSEVPPGPYTLADLGGDVVDLLDRLGLDEVALCGVSLGGMVAMWVAATVPDRVRTVALCCTALRFGDEASWLERAAQVRRDGMEAISASVVERWLTPGFAARRPGVARRLRDMLEAIPPEGYAACCEALARADATDAARAIKAPALIVTGAEDPTSTEADAEAIAAAVPDARRVVIPGAHLANVEEPEAFNAAILGHLDATFGGGA